MKLFAILGVFVLLAFVGIQTGNSLFSSVSNRTNLAATFINDSVIVDLGEDDFVEPTPEEGSGSIPTNADDTETVVFEDDNNNSDGVIDEVVITVSDDSNSGSGTTETNQENDDANNGGGTSSNNSANSETEQTVSAQSILNTLTGSQAVTSSGSSIDGSGGFGTSVSGSKTREALLSRKITNLLVPNRFSQSNSNAENRSPYSRADLALIVSAELVTNPELEDVFYTTNAITMTYKARGRLLFTLPVPYTASLELKFDEDSTKRRVQVKFPWYKFLMWTGVSKNVLRAEVDGVIIAAPEGQDYDRAARVFEEVAALLKSTQGFRGLQ